MPASTKTCSDKPHYVYVLRCPETATAFYVGCTVEPKKRMAHHITMAKEFNLNRSELYTHIREMLERGLRPYMELISGPLPHHEAYKLEKEVIKRSELGSVKLLNFTHTKRATKYPERYEPRHDLTLTADEFAELLEEVRNERLTARAAS